MWTWFLRWLEWRALDFYLGRRLFPRDRERVEQDRYWW